jgi:hypothetical protein
MTESPPLPHRQREIKERMPKYGNNSIFREARIVTLEMRGE